MMMFGIVEDINDPEELGRVRVRVYNIHTWDTIEVPTDSLPWAAVVQPTTSAANSGVGTTPRLLPGSLVMLTFTDPGDYQFPIVMGTLPSEIKEYFLKVEGTEVPWGQEDVGFQDPAYGYPRKAYIGDKDISKAARYDTCEETPNRKLKNFLRQDDNGEPIAYATARPPKVSTVATDKYEAYYAEQTWVEPEVAGGSKPVYPNNQVKQTPSGHVEEFDDTPGGRRYHRFHPSGSFEEIVDDGTRTIKVIGKNYEMYLDGSNIFIDGNVNMTVSGDKRELIQGNYHLEVEGAVSTFFHNSWQSKVAGNFEQEIDKSRSVNVGVNDNTTVAENRTVIVNGNEYENINGEADYITQGEETRVNYADVSRVITANNSLTATGDQVITTKGIVTQKQSQLDIKTAGNKTEETTGNETISVTGEQNITASKTQYNNDVHTTADFHTSSITLNTHVHSQPNTGSDATTQGDTGVGK